MFNLPNSPSELADWLLKRGFSKAVVETLKANKVGGDTFLKFTRADLADIYPDSFLTRKNLWDLLEDLRNHKDEHPEDQVSCIAETPPEMWPTGILDTAEDLSLTYSPPVNSSTSSSHTSSKCAGKRKRSSSPATKSTVSVSSASSIQSHEKQDIDPLFPKLRRTSAMKVDKDMSRNEENIKENEEFLKKFHFPLGKEVKSCIERNLELNEKIRKKFIRDCVTCLQVASNDKDGDITTEEFKLAAKKICTVVPPLKDKKPPSWEKSIQFPYWSSVLFMLRKRYHNIKYSQSKNKVAEEDSLSTSTSDHEQDDAQHLKEINRELKKKEPNWKALQELQSLSFKKRKDFISTLDGRCVVETVFEKFPFLKHEQMLLNELELHVLQIKKKKVTIDDFRQNFKLIAPYFEENEDEDSGQILESMQRTFSLNHQPFLLFIPEDEQDIDDFLKTAANITNSPTLAAFFSDEDDQSQLFIVIDKQIQLNLITSDYLLGVLVLISVFYTFNIAYEKQAMNFFKFIEKHVLGLELKKESVSLKKIENRIFTASK